MLTWHPVHSWPFSLPSESQPGTHITARPTTRQRWLHHTSTTNISTPTNDKPFHFLARSPEVRNQIYAYLVTYNTGNEHHWTHACIGMTQASRQLRTELRPLYWTCTSIEISLCHVDDFRAAFLVENSTSISNVTVKITSRDILPECGWDVLSLLLARAQRRNVRWKLLKEQRPCIRYRMVYPCGELRYVFEKIADFALREILDDVKVGTLAVRSLDRCNDSNGKVRGWEFRINVVNGRGKLNQKERASLCRHSDFLADAVFPPEWRRPEDRKRLVVVRADVKRRNGKVVEKYVWEMRKGRLVRVKGGRKTKGSKKG